MTNFIQVQTQNQTIYLFITTTSIEMCRQLQEVDAAEKLAVHRVASPSRLRSFAGGEHINSHHALAFVHFFVYAFI